ncbi:hypothetical protein [Pseudomonas sp.]|uniref:hypothetical protein n=1 Tax=Pseudomonas sp. TaxID=306 RepID=UPI0028A5D582|nr:hypothetical protein [Pseudomonas sp.]
MAISSSGRAVYGGNSDEVERWQFLAAYRDGLAIASSTWESFIQGQIKKPRNSSVTGLFNLNRPGFPRHFPSSGNSAFQNPLAIAA